MDGFRDYHTKSQNDKCLMMSHKCGILKKMIQMNLFTNKNRPTDIENKLMVTKGEGFSSVQSLSRVQLFATP